MESNKWSIAIVFLLLAKFASAQPKPINDKEFFKDDKIIEVKLSTDIKGLLAEKKDLNYIGATMSLKFQDGTVASGPVQVKPRGNFRKDRCRIASLMIDFKNPASPAFSKLGTLKLVGGCNTTDNNEQDLLQEYLVYKMYNMLTDLSFRVRLLHVNYSDVKGKIKAYDQYAFLIEDVDDLAKRNQCREKENIVYPPLGMRRDETTLFYLFQYMIGNTDWSIPYYHNVKLLVDKSDTLSMPYPIAYDFDITGLVNPYYGAPPPQLGIERLTQRLYRGHERSIEEIEVAVKSFLEKEESFYALINNFDLLTPKSKKEMINFLEEFYAEIKNKNERKRIFVDNALKN
ncbi:hypothetical protein [Lacibacter sp. H407]|uniref:hypothetical protein n=1 Tax=Lacibacter sp. H407 TaxID=3133423 RepID=UPI0030C4B70B